MLPMGLIHHLLFLLFRGIVCRRGASYINKMYFSGGYFLNSYVIHPYYVIFSRTSCRRVATYIHIISSSVIYFAEDLHRIHIMCSSVGYFSNSHVLVFFQWGILPKSYILHQYYVLFIGIFCLRVSSRAIRTFSVGKF